MRRSPRPLLTIAALAAIVVSAACTTPPTAAPAAVLAPPAAMRTEGVPALPAAPLEAAQRYNRVAGHGYADWHPSRREMLADNEGHGFARRENADYYFAALMQFLQQTLKP